MNGRLYKIRMVFVILFLVTVFVPFQAVAAHGGGQGNTPQELMANGWVCWPRLINNITHAFCMNPSFDPAFPNVDQLPASVINKIFKVSDSTFANPVYLGTSVYLREDLYAGQPCPSNAQPDWVSMIGGRYYNCRHFE